MKHWYDRLASGWARVDPKFLPFADAASAELPLGRLMRLSLFQVSVAMAFVLLNGTLNRVMIVELGVPAAVIAAMVSLPLLFAPLRVLIGFKSDNHISAIGWRRVPYIWIGSLLQFGGLAIMPFALLILSGDTHGPAWIGTAGAALAFLLVGAGMHTTQTAGLALATDLAPAASRPRVVAFLYVMLLFGMVASSLVFGWLLSEFSQLRLIQVVQGAAMVTMVLNIVALWKQEVRNPQRTARREHEGDLFAAWNALKDDGHWSRMLVAVGLGTAAFAMQDILLEPFGGEILKLSVGATTKLTGLLALGTLAGLCLAAHQLNRDADPYRLAGLGTIAGLTAFPAVIVSGSTESAWLFATGTMLIGFGSGLFSVGMLTAVMNCADTRQAGLALGAWGGVQATAAGLAVASGGAIRDVTTRLGADGHLGPAFAEPSAGYSVVYNIEIILLFATLVALGPLVRTARLRRTTTNQHFGLAGFPG